MEQKIIGNCRICGEKGEGIRFDGWVRDTFTNYDLLKKGEIICSKCVFWFDQKSTELQQRMGKDKPQKMQNYSHFIIGDEWLPVSKGDKPLMAKLLLSSPFPTLAAIAISGQKHIAFRARRNPASQSAGWVQFEEQTVWVEQSALSKLLKVIEDLYTCFSKDEIGSGNYRAYLIMQFGVERWRDLEQYVRPLRQTILFQLALFLAQRSHDGRNTSDGSDAAENYLAGHTGGLQKSIPDDNLGTVRERNTGRELHQQSGQVHQLDLLAPAGGPGQDGGGTGSRGGDTQECK